MLYIGIDLGTSAVKLILMDRDGRILSTVSKSYPIEYPHSGWSQQNPEDWLRETIAGVKELLRGFDPKQVAGIGAGGQMHGLVVLDCYDKVIRPAILWNDGRTARETEYLNTVIGKEKLTALTGNIAFAGFTAPKLLWMRENEPELFAKINKIMLPKDYITYMLTGVFATDCSDASGTLLFDVKNRCWSREMCDICGVRPEQLPKAFESYEVVGTLRPDMAARLGLPDTVKVVAGAGDNAAAAVGTGTVGDGECNLSVGTSGTVFISGKAFGVDEHNALHAFGHADGSWHLLGCMLSAGSSNKWFQESILGNADLSQVGAEIKDDMLGRNEVYFLPYLMGERSPINDPFARGTFIGMTAATTQTDMTQAVLEGVAFAFRDMLEAAKTIGYTITRSKICGGGAKNPLWRRIFANVLGLELDILAAEEGPAYGGAMLAAVGCGEYRSVEACAQSLVKVVDTVKPEPELTARYQERYEKFGKIYPAVRALFSELL
jgi:xylulokinase